MLPSKGRCKKRYRYTEIKMFIGDPGTGMGEHVVQRTDNQQDTVGICNDIIETDYPTAHCDESDLCDNHSYIREVRGDEVIYIDVVTRIEFLPVRGQMLRRKQASKASERVWAVRMREYMGRCERAEANRQSWLMERERQEDERLLLVKGARTRRLRLT